MIILLLRLLLIILFMRTESKIDRGKIAVYLKKMGQDPSSGGGREQEGAKIVVKADKMINYSENNSNYFTNFELLPDSLHTMKRNSHRHMEDSLYRSLEAKAGLTQRERKGNYDGLGPIKSEIKRHGQLESIDGQEKSTSRHKIYQIPISSKTIAEKIDKNGSSFLKLTQTNEQKQLISLSQNFNTYFQFKQYMSKVSNQVNKDKRNQSKYVSIMNNTKKCSIMPALKPSIYRPRNSQSYKKPSQSNDGSQEYLQTKKTKIKMEKSFVIESKKQELVTHIISRFKYTIKPKEEDNDADVWDEEKAETSKLEGLEKKQKDESNKNHEKHKVKHPKNISFYFNSHEDGVYQQKIRSYRELLFIVNLAHRIFDPLVILDGTVIKLEKTAIVRPTYFIGPGNNAMLVRSLMKRRIWWDEVKTAENANFVWTQLKINSIYSNQSCYQKPQEAEQAHESLENGRQSEAKLQVKIMKRRKSSKDLLSTQKLLTAQKCNYSYSDSKKQLNANAINVPKGLMFRAPFSFQAEEKILIEKDYKYYKKMMDKVSKGDSDNFDNRIKYFSKGYLTPRNVQQKLQVHNHFECNHSLGNKKALFYHMRLYYKLTNKPVIKAFPQTYHIRLGENDPQFKMFLEEYQRVAREEKQLRNVWILKPGENSNRGCGITVIKEISQIKRLIRARQKHKNGEYKTFILQKYIQRPLLYCGRKFDIRHYMIITGMHGKIRAYWYGQGYIRTSSYLFNLEEVRDPMIHLTNDAIQKNSEDYGCFEEGNKVSYNQLQKYFTKEFPQKKFEVAVIFAKMRELARDAVQATYISLDPNNRLHNFEVFGLDFMIDDNLDVMLIEVNTNPCLELSSSLLGRIIPAMLEQSFRISLDSLFPPPMHYTNNTRHFAPDCNLQKLQLQLIFDSGRDGPDLVRLYAQNSEQYKQMMNVLQGSEKQLDQTFQNDGEEIQAEKLIV